jgi:protein ImuB
MNGTILPSPLQEDAAARADCSCPRGGGWRPGARWAERRGTVAAEIAALPPHQRPQMRELGRRTEAAAMAFKPSLPPQAVGRGTAAAGGGGGVIQRLDTPPPSAASMVPLPIRKADGEDRALVTTHRVGQRIVIAAACPEAQRQGLTPGIALTQARVLVPGPGLEVREAAPARDAALLMRLALLAARRWTPRAAVDGDGLWLDLSGVAHLFGGEARLCQRIIAACARRGLTARIAVAGSYGAAHALARAAVEPVTLCPNGAEAEALGPLPLTCLRIDAQTAAAVARLGLERVSDILAMPRAPLRRRFAGLLGRLDQALGRMPEPFEPIVPEEPPAITLRFAEPIGSAEAIGQAMADAMAPLIADLGKAGLGVRLLRLVCTRVDDREEEARVGTARATRDGAHLLRLLTPKIETIDPGFGIERMELIATRVEPLGAVAIEGELAGARPAPDLAPLIDRLAGRLGPRRLYRMSALESDVPERSVARVTPLALPDSWPDWPRPVRLFTPPEPLSGVVALLPDQPPRRFTWRGRAYRVVRADGPERIHGEWWRRRSETEAARDYFAVEDEAGRRFWLFRKGDGVDGRTGDLSWWMQGLFG